LYSLVLFCSAACVVVLYLDRTLLDVILPNWRATIGLVLLTVTALTVMVGLLRIARAMSFVLLWGFVALVLATEIFFGKLPVEFFSEELQVPDTAESGDRFETAIRQLPLGDANAGRVILLGGANAEGVPEAIDGYFDRLEQWLKARGERVPVNLTLQGASTFQLQQILERLTLSPSDTVVVAPPFVDSRVAPNAFGERGVSEIDTIRQRREDSQRQDQFGARLIRGSRLVQILAFALTGMSSEPLTAAVHQSPRLRPEERGVVLQEMARRVSGAGARMILVTEPTLPGEIDRRYEEVVTKVAAEKAIPVVQLANTDALRARMRFLRGPILSPVGQQEMAEAVIESFKERSPSISEERIIGAEGFLAVVRGSEIAPEIIFDTQVLDPGDDYFLYSLEVDGKVIEDRRQNTREIFTLRFSVPPPLREADFLRIRLAIAASPPAEQDRIGQLPFPVQVKSDLSGARIQSGSDRYGCASPESICVVRIEPATGTIREVFDQPASAEAALQLGEWLRRQEWGSIVVGGTFLSRSCPECVAVLRSIGVNATGGAGRALGFIAVTGERGERAEVSERNGSVDLSKGGSRGERLSRFKLLGVRGLPGR
jgi:hypothetical protein